MLGTGKTHEKRKPFMEALTRISMIEAIMEVQNLCGSIKKQDMTKGHELAFED